MRHPDATRQDRDRWGTPPWMFDRLDAVFHFDLDAAAEAHNTKCNTWLVDGLAPEPWPGRRVWLNPPYSISAAFLDRAATESSAACVVALIPSRTETAWWHDIVQQNAREVAFFRGRIAFVPPPGLELSPRGNRPVFASALAVFGDGPSLLDVDLSPRRNSSLITAGQRELPMFSLTQP